MAANWPKYVGEHRRDFDCATDLDAIKAVTLDGLYAPSGTLMVVG